MTPEKIKNINYRKFLDEGLIDILTLEELKAALSNIRGQYRTEGRALLIALYYTGGRPVEVLNLKGKDIQRKDSYVTIHLQPSKRGLHRTMFLPYRYMLVKELYMYATKVYPEMLMFHHYRNSYKRKVKLSNGTIATREDISDKLRYHVKQWFKGVRKGSITPYFLRHNRFSQLSEAGLQPQDIQMLKGSKTAQSVQPYLHLSTQSAQKIAKKIK